MFDNDPDKANIPNLGGSTGPTLGGSTPTSMSDIKPVDETGIKEEVSTVHKMNIHDLIRKYKVKQRKVQKSLQTMMLYEFKTKVSLTPLNKLYRDLITILFQGQLNYLDEMISTIKKKKDPLSKYLKKQGIKRGASTQVFETLKEIIEEELEDFQESKPEVMDEFDEDFKKYRDSRTEPRMCYWILISTGLQLVNIKNRHGDDLDIVLDVMVRYRPALKRALGVFMLFCYYLIDEIEPYPIDLCNLTLTPGPTNTGYNMAPWIKYRYGTNSQSYIEYERFIKYFVSSFGKVPGNASAGPKEGFRQWIQRTLSRLEQSLLKSTLLTNRARGMSLEGILVGLIEELQEEMDTREYDVDGKVTNYPVGAEGAIKFLEWLFETGLQRFKTTNIASHKDIRLTLDMFDFIESTIRWINEYGERIVVDWLGDGLEDH